MTFKPLLAATIDDIAKTLETHGPMFVSPKLDGVRCLIMDGQAVSRNLKPIPNRHIQAVLGKVPYGFDGELIVGNVRDRQVFQQSQSGVMSHEGTPAFTYWVFDQWDLDEPFHKRLELTSKAVKNVDYAQKPRKVAQVKFVGHKIISKVEQLLDYEGTMLALGYEGVMLRRLDGAYKNGRSTLREGILLKFKRFQDSEAIVIGYNEQETNNNAATTDKLGHTVRSSHKAGKNGAGKLGSLVVRDCASKVEFELGTGFTDQDRTSLWHEQSTLLGRRLTYTFQPTGVKDKPRFPSFKGWRHEGDA